MRRILLAIAGLALIFTTNAFAQPQGKTLASQPAGAPTGPSSPQLKAPDGAHKQNPQGQPNRADRKRTKPPAGFTLSNNTVRRKSGYEFAETGANQVSVRNARTKDVAGTFECRCLAADGSCGIKIKGLNMRCTSRSNCQNNCQIHVVYSATSPGVISQ